MMDYKNIVIILFFLAFACFAQDIEAEEIMGDSVVFIQRVNICSEIDLEGIAVDDTFPGAYVDGDFAIWEHPMSYFLSDSCFWDYRCNPGHTFDGFNDSLVFRLAIWRHGYAYCGVYSTHGDVSDALFLLCNKEVNPVTTWGRPLTRDDIYTGAFFSRDYSQNMLSQFLHHQYEKITDNGHVLSGALPILKDRLCLDPPADSSGSYLYGYNLLDFALFNNLDKPVWTLASKIQVRRGDGVYSGCWYSGIPVIEGPTGASYFIENNTWCALCPDSMGLCTGESQRGFSVGYSGADNSAIRMSGGSNNMTEAWGYLDGVLRMHILNCCTRDYASANYYAFDTFPDSVRMRIDLSRAAVQSNIRMAVLADSIWADDIWEDPDPGHDSNPPPIIIRADPGWNGVLQPEITVTPSETLDMGPVLVGESAINSFLIDNIGDTTLVITTIHHSNPSDFGLLYDVYTPAHTSSDIMVSFNPTSAGHYEDIVTVYTNVPCFSMFNLYIVGEGIEIDPMFPELVEPLPGTWTSCADQNIILRGICSDTNCCGKIMEESVVLDVGGVLHTGADSSVRVIDDTLIYYTPYPPHLFRNGDTVEVCLANAADTCGVVFDSLPYCWSFMVDLNPPDIIFHYPPPDTVLTDPSPTISICLFDSLSGLDTNSIVLNVDGEVAEPIMIFADSCYLLEYPLPNPMHYSDTLEYCIRATDTTDYCPDNTLDTCFYFSLWSAGPLGNLIIPWDGAVSACTNQEIHISIVDSQGVDSLTIILAIGGDTLTIADSRLSFIDDSLLIFVPNEGYWNDNDTITISLIAANDNLGAPLGNPFSFDFYTDFTPPVSELVQPIEDEWIQYLETPVGISFEDRVSGILLDSCYLDIEGHIFHFAEILADISPDSRRGNVVAYPSEAGLNFNPGDSIFVTCYMCDDPDTCPPNCSETVHRILFEPMATCQIYPNPFSPNADGVNDFIVFDYPRMFIESAQLSIFNIKNRQVLKKEIGPTENGEFEIRSWDGKDDTGAKLPPGLYIYIISNDNRVLCSGTAIIAR